MRKQSFFQRKGKHIASKFHGIEQTERMCLSNWLPIVRQLSLLGEMYSIHTICNCSHYNNVIMRALASQTTSLTIVYSTVYSDADQRNRQWIPAQRTSNAENVSIWWRHHVCILLCLYYHWLRFHVIHLPIFSRVASLALGESYDMLK